MSQAHVIAPPPVAVQVPTLVDVTSSEIADAETIDLTDEALAWLSASAISLDVALEAGIFCVSDGDWTDDWESAHRAHIPHMIGKRPAVIFPWRDPWHEEALQATVWPRDDYWKTLKSKYVFEKDSGGRCNLLPREEKKLATISEKTVRRLVIVEGTKQALAAVTANVDDDGLPIADTIVVGMAGCWGWRARVKEDGRDEDASATGPAPWLTKILKAMRPTDVVLILDADVASNPDVHRAARLLSEFIDTYTTGVLR